MKYNALSVLGAKKYTHVYSSVLFLGTNAQASLRLTARGTYQLHAKEGEMSDLRF